MSEEVVVEEIKESWSCWYLSPISFNKERGEFVLAREEMTCRSTIQELLYAEQHPKNNALRFNTRPGYRTNKNKNIMFFYVKDLTVEECKGILIEVNKLNQLEKEYGIKETKVHFSHKHTTGVLFFGDKVWKSNMWKMSIYTLLLKHTLHRTKSVPFNGQSVEIMSAFTKHKHELMSRIISYKDEEILADTGDLWQDTHNNCGFYCILTGKNENMRNKLGLPKYTPPEGALVI